MAGTARLSLILLLVSCVISSSIRYESTPTATTSPTASASPRVCKRARICGCGTEDIKDGWMNYDNYTFWEPFSHPLVEVSGDGCGGKTEVLTRNLTNSNCPDADHCGPMPTNPWGPSQGPGWPEGMKCVDKEGNMGLEIMTTFYDRAEVTSRPHSCSVTLRYKFQDAASLGYSLSLTSLSHRNTWDTSNNFKFLNQTTNMTLAMGEAQTGIWYDKPIYLPFSTADSVGRGGGVGMPGNLSSRCGMDGDLVFRFEQSNLFKDEQLGNSSYRWENSKIYVRSFAYFNFEWRLCE